MLSAIVGGISLTLFASMLSSRLTARAKINDALIERVAQFVGYLLIGYFYFRAWDALSTTYTYDPAGTKCGPLGNCFTESSRLLYPVYGVDPNMKHPRVDEWTAGLERELRPYERARAEEVLALQALTHGLKHLFHPPLAPLAWLRNTGLNLTNRLPVIRNTLVRYALG